MKKVCEIVIACLCLTLLAALTAQSQVVDRWSLTNKVVCGYQGWFACPGDGNDPGVGWNHWSEQGDNIGPGLYHTEIWPDTREYDASDLFFVPDTVLTQGGTPYLFSNYRQGAVNVHFRWMLENNIDGVLHQRFVGGYVGDPSNPWQHKLDVVLQNVMNAANTYGRAFAVEYDISGVSDADVYNKLIGDWTYLTTAFDIKNHPRLLHHNGKPVVVIWGFGFNDRPGTAQTAIDTINWFKNNGCFVVGGVPGGWRTLSNCKTEPLWHTAYRTYDCISPWTVGAYNNWDGINWWRNNMVIPDLNECNSLGILYMPVAWPRFGWDNMHNYPCGQSDISPRGGQHFWDQFYAWKSAGVPCQKIAMFDEYDESTAIMKLTDNIPTTGCWWTTEGLGEDWYLRLANQGSKMQRGEIACSQTMPINSATSPDNSQYVSDTIPSTMDAGRQYNVSVTMRNTGETTWSQELFRLGTVGDSDPFYGTNRVAMAPGTAVVPNAQYTFNFTMTAPTTPGPYTSDWQMVHEAWRWFGATLAKQINVTYGFLDLFSYANGNLNGNGGWSGSATSEIAVSNQTVQINGGAGTKDAARTVYCGDPGTGYITVRAKIKRGVGDASMWSLYIDDTAGHNMARWYGSGTTARGRIGGTADVTATQTLSGGWDDLRIVIIPSANTSEFIFNGVSIGVLSHASQGAGDVVGALRFERSDNSGAVGQYVYFDNLRIGETETTPPGPVTALTATPGDGQNALSWTNPTDPDRAGTMVRFSTLGYPGSPSGGTLCYDGTGSGFTHTGLTNSVTYYYSAFTYDAMPNWSGAAIASAVPEIPPFCFRDEFNYANGALVGQGGWTGNATVAHIEVVDQKVRMWGGKTAYNALKTVNCTSVPTGFIWVRLLAYRGTGTANMWNVWINDSAGKNFARWYGSGTTARGRIGTSSIVTTVQNLTGGGVWDSLVVKINPTANTTQFYFNGADLGTYSHGTQPNNVVSQINIQRENNSAAAGNSMYLDDIRISSN